MKSKGKQPDDLWMTTYWGSLLVVVQTKSPLQGLVVLDWDSNEATRWSPGDLVTLQGYNLERKLEPEEWL